MRLHRKKHDVETEPWPLAWITEPKRIDAAIRIVTDGQYADLAAALDQLEAHERLNDETNDLHPASKR